MINRSFKFLLLFVLLFFPFMVKAECDYQRINDLSKIANNVKLSNFYDNNSFTVIVSNLSSDLYAVDFLGNTYYGGEEKRINFSSGDVSFEIYSNDSSCQGEMLAVKEITLPVFNVYSNRSECLEYPEFKYCVKWGDFKINDDQFLSELDKYKLTFKSQIVKKDDEYDLFSYVFSLFSNNIFLIFLFTLIILLILFLLFKRKTYFKYN